MYYTAIDVAKYIVSKCIGDNHPISNLQLQKILYCIQRDYLKRSGKFAFADNIEAWQIGPVVPNVYYHYCGWGTMTIVVDSVKDEMPVKEEDRELIDPIIESKRILSPCDFSKDIQREKGAWAKVFRNGIGNKKVISTELIRRLG